MIHELGHLIGLGHVLSPAEIMFTQLGVQRGQAEYHGGDLDGLKILGAQSGCLAPPPAPTRP
ncbi:MAG: matrixin family metalloprotease, partial [Acidimicrobiales bacterium]